MKTVHKFPFGVNWDDGLVLIKGPTDFKFLCVQVQRGVPCIWATVETESKITTHMFLVRGTGTPLGDVGTYLGTFQMHDGALVFHLFAAS